MAINASSDNPLYLTYRNVGPTFALIGPALLLWIIGLAGVGMNSFVVWVTIKSSSMRGTANYLIAIICTAEALHQFGHTLFVVIVISGINFIDLQLAAWLSLPQHFCICAILMGILLTSIDRLLAIAAENLYQKISLSYKLLYLSMYTVIITVYGGIGSFLVIRNGNIAAGTPTTGCLAEILPLNSDIKLFWFALLVVPLIFSGFFYLLIALIIRCNKNVTSKTNTRLLRSLSIIVGISIGGYVVNFTAYEILYLFDFGLSFVAIWHISFIPGAILNLCAACNAPILFINSTEYRKAFIQQLSYFKQNQVVSTSANRFPHPNGQIRGSIQSNHLNSRRLSPMNIDVRYSIPNQNH